MFFHRVIFFSILVLGCVGVSFGQTGFHEGKALYETGKYENAAAVFLEVVKRNEKNQMAWRFLGMAYARLKRDELANQAFDKASKLIPAKKGDSYKWIKFLSRPGINFAEIARKNRVPRSVTLALEVNREGAVEFVYPYKSSMDEMTKKIVAGVRKIEFEPATQDGKAITVIAILKYRVSFY